MELRFAVVAEISTRSRVKRSVIDVYTVTIKCLRLGRQSEKGAYGGRWGASEGSDWYF